MNYPRFPSKHRKQVELNLVLGREQQYGLARIILGYCSGLPHDDR